MSLELAGGLLSTQRREPPQSKINRIKVRMNGAGGERVERD